MDFEQMTEDELWAATTDETGAARGHALYQLGVRTFRRQAYEESAALCETSAVAFAEQGHQWDEAWARYGVGAAFFNLGRFAPAASAYVEAVALFRTAGSELEVAGALASAADALSEAGDPDAALEHWAGAIEFACSAGDFAVAARSAIAAADQLGRLGRYADALTQLQEARGLGKRAGDAAVVAGADDRAATAFIELGQLDDAVHALDSAWHIVEALDDRGRLAYARYRLGKTLSRMGRYDDAVTHLEASHQLADEVEDRLLAARCDHEAATILSNIGRTEEAIALYLRIAPMFDALGHESEWQLARANLAVAYTKQGDLRRAAEVNTATLHGLRESGSTDLRAGVATALAGNLLDLDRPDEALQVLEDNPDERSLLGVDHYPAWHRLLKARALRAIGRRTEAAYQLGRLASDLEGTAHDAALAGTLESLSDLQLAAGDQRTAEWNRTRAVALFLAVGDVVAAGRVSAVFVDPAYLAGREAEASVPTLPWSAADLDRLVPTPRQSVAESAVRP